MFLSLLAFMFILVVIHYYSVLRFRLHYPNIYLLSCSDFRRKRGKLIRTVSQLYKHTNEQFTRAWWFSFRLGYFVCFCMFFLT